jgi:hypothetical protein
MAMAAMALVQRLKASNVAVMKREKRLFMVKSLQKLTLILGRLKSCRSLKRSFYSYLLAVPLTLKERGGNLQMI